MRTAEISDADLVAESLSANKDAFRQIVERYQTLVTSIAFSSTGSVSQSEDVAQETFVTAWRQLAELREPAKLRPWICQIARFLLSKKFRHQDREPVHQAESLDAIEAWPSSEPLPSDSVIEEEEKALLWRSLERIPEIYREPLVLFYREDQSIENVARDLDLSEDAVKQRLSRGRRMLQEQWMASVEGALKQTSPGRTFTLGVMAALPLLATTAKAASATTIASKAGTAAKTATGGGVVAAMLSGAGLFILSLFGVFGLAGRWVGREMGLAGSESLLARKRTLQFFRTLAIGFAVCVLPTTLVTRSLLHTYPWMFEVNTWMLTAFYFVTVGALAIWAWRKRHDARRPHAETTVTNLFSDRSYVRWVALGTLGPTFMVAFFMYSLFFTNWTLSAKWISSEQAQQIVAGRTDAHWTVLQYQDGSKQLEIHLPENGRTALFTRLDDPLAAVLAARGVSYATLIENLDFHDGGFQGWLVLLCTFISVAGVALLLRRPGSRMFYCQKSATPRAERREKKILLVLSALGMIFLSGLLALMGIVHAGQRVPAAVVKSIIDDHQDARIDLFTFGDGSKELWVTPPGSRRYPRYIAPADEATLAWLTQSKLSYRMYVQGRDFGFRGPSMWFALTGSFLLAAGAVGVFWWTVRSRPRTLETATLRT